MKLFSVLYQRTLLGLPHRKELSVWPIAREGRLLGIRFGENPLARKGRIYSRMDHSGIRLEGTRHPVKQGRRPRHGITIPARPQFLLAFHPNKVVSKVYSSHSKDLALSSAARIFVERVPDQSHLHGKASKAAQIRIAVISFYFIFSVVIDCG
ncbi:hypothetical protein IE53DRAFT_7936 [Violaceomyces palustris]|uniref:Uncharacterized protein n=1 Tax=Violaceomyces palustris TaxID=1673888 RepID=A0ACD0P2M9_9BASI|nr:hypothetical protein IE53DRAFT_7936 [Violaceomyces palustris]